MKGNLIRRIKTATFEGEIVIDSTKWYEIIDVSEDGVAAAFPVGEEPSLDPCNIRLFYLCANECELG